MKKFMASCIAVLFVAGFATACTSSDVGMVGGGVVGGVAGSALTGGSTAGTIAGAVGGGLIGREIAN